MKPELVREYKRILANLLNALIKEQIPQIVVMLERIPDDAADLREQFQRRSGASRVPSYWISLLRIIRLSQVLRADIQEHYDHFLDAYRYLTNIGATGAHQERLLKECGEVLYRVDETFGNHERCVLRIVEEVNRLLVQRFGIQPEPTEDFYRMLVNDEDARVIAPLVEQLVTLCDGMLDLLRELVVLEDVRALLLRK